MAPQSHCFQQVIRVPWRFGTHDFPLSGKWVGKLLIASLNEVVPGCASDSARPRTSGRASVGGKQAILAILEAGSRSTPATGTTSSPSPNSLPRDATNLFLFTWYRSIPLARYPTLLLSIFILHNEFLNIQTHLLPLVLWDAILRPADPAEGIFITYVLICLGSSVIWHTMAGCAHRSAMEFCARVDYNYVGIGLISVCIGTIVYYGYAGNPHLAYPFLAVCLLLTLRSSVLAFMALLESRLWRLAFKFFLSLVFCDTVFIAGLAILHGLGVMFVFVALQSHHVLWNSYSTARTSQNASLRRVASGSSGWRTLATPCTVVYSFAPPFITITSSPRNYKLTNTRGLARALAPVYRDGYDAVAHGASCYAAWRSRGL
ncbi:hypothetical protein C8R44DRAFT_929672 [Mycena epipterygia]|nr:hypothetical protein C8R44DRAFT_929672 [Mycena epipterygia]